MSILNKRKVIVILVKDIMKKPISCSSYLPLHELAKIMLEHDIGLVPIVDDNKLVGVISDRDIIIRAIVDGRYDANVGEIMTEALITINVNESLENAFRTLISNKIRRLLVTENDKLVGVIGLKDFIENTHILTELENIYLGKGTNRFYHKFDNGNPNDGFDVSQFRT